jgi:hypothetical protein
MAPLSWSGLACALLLMLLSLFAPSLAADTQYVTATVNGEEVLVKDTRQPSLYTGDFGDCMGSSSINVTRFDAAYYRDNMTVLFHLGGETALKNESIMSMVQFLQSTFLVANGPNSVHRCICLRRKSI